MSCIAADVINDVSLSLNDSPLVCKELAASSETVSPETLIVTAPVAAFTLIPVPATLDVTPVLVNVTVPDVPPPLRPVPAVTPVIVPLPPPPVADKTPAASIDKPLPTLINPSVLALATFKFSSKYLQALSVLIASAYLPSFLATRISLSTPSVFFNGKPNGPVIAIWLKLESVYLLGISVWI